MSNKKDSQKRQEALLRAANERQALLDAALRSPSLSVAARTAGLSWSRANHVRRNAWPASSSWAEDLESYEKELQLCITIGKLRSAPGALSAEELVKLCPSIDRRVDWLRDSVEGKAMPVVRDLLQGVEKVSRLLKDLEQRATAILEAISPGHVRQDPLTEAEAQLQAFYEERLADLRLRQAEVREEWDAAEDERLNSYHTAEWGAKTRAADSLRADLLKIEKEVQRLEDLVEDSDVISDINQENDD